MTSYPEPGEPASRLTRHQAYARWIENTCRTDPGARTVLRKGLRRHPDDIVHTRGMHRLLTPWLPKGPETAGSEQRAYFTVASLIAAQPRYSFTASDGPDAVSEGATVPATGTPAEAPPDSRPTPAVGPGPSASTRGDSLGVAFAHAVTKGAGREREMRQSTAETRLNLLTRQSLDGLHRHLPATVLYLRGFEAPIDWARLITDLIDWPVRSGRISRRWLQDFYWLCAASDRAKAAQADQRETLETEPDD